MIYNNTHSNMLISPARSIIGRVEHYSGSTLLHTFRNIDALKSFTISRAGENKFFGFGVCQEIELKLVDKKRAINIDKDDILKPSFTADGITLFPTPLFYVTDVARDENTNELTVKGKDIIHKAKSHTLAEIGLEAPYTVLDVIRKIAEFFGIEYGAPGVYSTLFNIEYTDGANFDGTETLREVLDAIADATLSHYYINFLNQLTFKQITFDDEPALTINKANYFTLESKEERTLSAICSATELGDNVIVNNNSNGETQYIRDNAFLELREDVADILEHNFFAIVNGIYINEFSCKWRGNYLLEPGDMIEIITKDNSAIYSYIFNDKYTYNGGLSAETKWEYGEKNGESADNPTTIGDALKKTYAKVDKANKEIELVSGETAEIKLTTNNIQTVVKQLDNNMVDVINEVNTKVTAQDVTFSIQAAMNNGIDRVTTTTGFTFNDEGLHISKTGSEITTSITEDGMAIYKNNSEVLVADNLGVKAEDLHATTYLIIGSTSRFENYGDNRTGCFWIGG